jgi:hypothetical protein
MSLVATSPCCCCRRCLVQWTAPAATACRCSFWWTASAALVMISRSVTALAVAADGLAATGSGPHSSLSFDSSARTGQNRFTWKTPSRAAFVPLQEPVAVLALLRSPHANAGMKQYECGRTQPLFHTGHDHGKTSGRNLKG